MRVKDIQESIHQFKLQLRSSDYDFPIYLYELPQRWDREYTVAGFKKLFTTRHTQRLWLRSAYQPLQHLLTIIEGQEEYFGHACYDLLNEDLTLEGRVSRFIFYMDELLVLYRNSHKNATLSDHHIDQSFVSLILNRIYPERYAVYRFKLFKATAQRIGAQPIPSVDDLERFEKFVKVYLNLMNKDESLLQLHKSHIRKYQLESDYLAANIVTECMMVNENFDLLKD